jgi:hypothetical protein
LCASLGAAALATTRRIYPTASKPILVTVTLTSIAHEGRRQ